MRDINPAERLLSLFTSPDSAAGIVGDLSEERGQHGSFWFWRQVLGTVCSLCRGALFESPAVVLLLVALGFAMSAAVSIATSFALVRLLELHTLTKSGLVMFAISALLSWPGKLMAGATMVAMAPRFGMAACVLLAAFHAMFSLTVSLSVFPHVSALWLLTWMVREASSVLFFLVGGALIRPLRFGSARG